METRRPRSSSKERSRLYTITLVKNSLTRVEFRQASEKTKPHQIKFTEGPISVIELIFEGSVIELRTYYVTQTLSAAYEKHFSSIKEFHESPIAWKPIDDEPVLQ